MKKISVKDMTFVAMFAALMCVISPFSLPIGPVPISLATLVVYVVAALLDYKRAPVVVLVYILIGLCGVPVFAGFIGGPGKLVGPTGGYLLGFVLCALVESLLITFFKKKKWIYPIAMVLGTIILYAFGTVWFMILTDYTFGKAMMVCVVPFLPGDAGKIVVASILGITLRDKYEKFVYLQNDDKIENESDEEKDSQEDKEEK